jgi:predicted transcriptional regulator
MSLEIQTQNQINSQDNFVLPSGKELKFNDVLHFCYGLTETDIRVLTTLLKSSPKTSDELSQELQVSKSIVNVSLRKLLNLGLVNRTKETGNKAGRPKYVYYTLKFDELKDKVVNEIEECTNNIRNLVSTQLALPTLVS